MILYSQILKRMEKNMCVHRQHNMDKNDECLKEQEGTRHRHN